MGSYVPSTKEERQEMLNTIGLQSFDELFQSIPEKMKVKELKLEAGLSELEVLEKMSGIANKNKVFTSVFRGAGAYYHHIPAIVKSVVSKEPFLTAYTPYQAEISQGILQSIFEYQTMICQLTDMEVSNASVYDGATAAAEAVAMCRERKRNKVLISAGVNPMVSDTIKTYCDGADVELVVIPVRDGITDHELLKATLDETTACFYMQQPNYFGQIEDGEKLGEIVHEKGAKFIMGVNPIACGLLKTPGECKADVAVGEGQPLGMPLGFGGPYLGFMTATREMVRKLPGRIVGETTDIEGKRAFVLTLQAREQHIRREKASSNICSNQALCALTAAVYMSAMGPKGMEEVAELCYKKAHYAAEEIGRIPGFSLKFQGEFFHEFVTGTFIPAEVLMKGLEEKGILGGLPVEDGILWCVTEMNSKTQIDSLIMAIKEVVDCEANI